MRSVLLVLSFAWPLLAQPFDVLIRNGRVIDGTGSPWYSADIGIRGGRIAAIGNLAAAAASKTIDARGMVVAPGFIDMLGQSELTILVEPAPAVEDLSGHHHRDHRRGRLGRAAERRHPQGRHAPPTSTTASRRTGATFAQYFARLEKQGIGINLATTSGATQVRRMVLGDDNRAADRRRSSTA